MHVFRLPFKNQWVIQSKDFVFLITDEIRSIDNSILELYNVRGQ